MGLGGRLVNAFQHVLIRSRLLEVCTSSSDAQPEGAATCRAKMGLTSKMKWHFLHLHPLCGVGVHDLVLDQDLTLGPGPIVDRCLEGGNNPSRKCQKRHH